MFFFTVLCSMVLASRVDAKAGWFRTQRLRLKSGRRHSSTNFHLVLESPKSEILQKLVYFECTKTNCDTVIRDWVNYRMGSAEVRLTSSIKPILTSTALGAGVYEIEFSPHQAYTHIKTKVTIDGNVAQEESYAPPSDLVCTVSYDNNGGALAPHNGAQGNCNITLEVGGDCQPLCDVGYHVSGVSSCTSGTDGIEFFPASCTDFDECAANPCQHGNCTEGMPGSYSCACVVGYVGDNCEFVWGDVNNNGKVSMIDVLSLYLNIMNPGIDANKVEWEINNPGGEPNVSMLDVLSLYIKLMNTPGVFITS